MSIAIRVDASNQIGTGHFMRCLTLADALKKRGEQIRFISRHMPEHLRHMLDVRGHDFMLLNRISSEEPSGDLSHSHWLGCSQTADAQDTIHALVGQNTDWLIVDHYALDHRWESALRKTTRNIMVIDDIADRRHDCDVLLDQNYYVDMSTRYSDKVPGHCQLLLGPHYALLREEFLTFRQNIRPRTGTVRRILVFLGGVDADNFTLHAITALASLKTSDLHVDVVIGAQHPFREQLATTCSQYEFNCHVQTDQMAELMAAADLAIGSGGSATWERCCLGLTTLTICTADNQRKQVIDAACEGLLYAPEMLDEVALVLKRHLHTLIANAPLRLFISRNAMHTVDGLGVLRVSGQLSCIDIEMRTVGPDDSRQLFEWRNHPDIRAVSRNTEIITWENHEEWFASVLIDPDKLLLIGHREDLPIGVVRFDIQGENAEVSIYLVPSISKASGQGGALLRSAERWVAINRPTVCKIRAHVIEGNKPSQQLFLGAGYQVESTYYSKRLH